MIRLARFIIALTLAHTLAFGSAWAQTPTESDLMALRFYIGEGNDQAVQSEIRRLQLSYPDWTPPDNLNEIQRDVPGRSVDKIYALIAADDFDGARAEIESTRQAYPDWFPSEELLQTLSVAEGQSRFIRAVDAADADAAIRIARANPALLRCERINNAWLLAEQYRIMGQDSSAVGVYRSILRSCTSSDDLIATLEKSAAVVDLNTLSELADLARDRAPDATEQVTIVENRLRAGLKAGPTRSTDQTVTKDKELDPTLAMVKSPRPTPRPEELDTSPTPTVQRRPSGAPAPKAPSGGASLSQAERAAARGDWNGCLAVTANGQSGAILSQRGWCALNAGRQMQALNDFQRAAKIGTSASARRDAAYGMALAMLQLNMVDQAANVAATTHFDKKQRLEIEGQILDKRGVFAFDRKDYRQAIAYFNELERLTGRMRRDLALLRGYAYLNSGQRAAAVAEFQRLHDQMATPASRRALSEALR